MSKSRLDRAQRLLNVQNQLLKIEEQRAQDLQLAKQGLETAEADAIAYLDKSETAPRLTAITLDRAVHLRHRISEAVRVISIQQSKVIEQAIAKRLAERLVKSRRSDFEREEADTLLAEITEVALTRSRFK